MYELVHLCNRLLFAWICLIKLNLAINIIFQQIPPSMLTSADRGICTANYRIQAAGTYGSQNTWTGTLNDWMQWLIIQPIFQFVEPRGIGKASHNLNFSRFNGNQPKFKLYMARLIELFTAYRQMNRGKWYTVTVIIYWKFTSYTMIYIKTHICLFH